MGFGDIFGVGQDTASGGPGGTPPIFAGPATSSPTTPTTAPSVPGAAPSQDDPMRKILEALVKSQAASTKPQLAPTGVQARPVQRIHELPPLFGITAGIQAIVAHEHQKKLAAATSDWNDLTVSLQKYIGPDGKVDPAAYQDPAVMQVLGDQKKLKLMAKALNQDWLNPEKTTVYSQALKASMAQQQQKQQAASGLKQLFSHLIKKSQNPQMNPQQQQDMASQVMSKAPIAMPQTDPAAAMKSEAELMTAYANLTKAGQEAKDKYQFIVGPDGKIVAADKSDPTKSITLTDQQGNPLEGQTKTGSSYGKPAMVNGVPVGIYGTRDGRPTIKLPGDADWTGEDAKTFSASKAATATADAQKDHRIQLASQARITSYLAGRMYPVQNADGTETFASGAQLSANPDKYSPLAGAAKVQAQKQIFVDLHYASTQMREAVAGMGDQGFDAKTRAQLLLALRSNDPRSAFSQFLSSEDASTLNDAQVNYVTAVAAAKESAMMLRTVGGMGSGSDMLREAVDKLVPGPGTPSAKFANRQLDLYDGQINRLERGVPSTAASNKSNEMETQTYNGKTYTRKKGTQDPWKLSN